MSDRDIETLFGERVALKLACIPLLDLDSMTERELRKRGLTELTARRIKTALGLGRRMLDDDS